MAYHLWALLVLACTCAGVFFSDIGVPIADSVAHAMDRIRLGDYVVAETELSSLALLAPENANIHLALGALAQIDGDVRRAIEHFLRALALEPSDGAHGNLGFAYFTLEDYQRAVGHLHAAVELNPERRHGQAHMLALTHHFLGDDVTAKEWFQLALAHAPQEPQVHFDYAVSLQAQGEAVQANEAYNRALALRPTFAAAWVNIASLHVLHGSIDTALRNFETTFGLSEPLTPELWLYATVNYAIALEMDGQISRAMRKLDAAHAMLRLQGAAKTPRYLAICEHKVRIWRATADWHDYERFATAFLHLTWQLELQAGLTSSMTAFTSLALPMHPSLRRAIAESTVRPLLRQEPLPPATPGTGRRRLHVGYLSYDFNNHPTAHLMEGLFRCHNASRVAVSVLSYGKDDNSSYRRVIRTLADQFVELASVGTHDAATRIRAAKLDILVDAQGHTLGHRHDIVAKQPAPIIINYLVFPGTLGAPYVDYLVADAQVAPPEHACQYMEKLMYMPHSYQVNYYAAPVTGHPRPQDRPFVFANFNKIEKLEPRVFGLWMQILRQIPRSELWLLTPPVEKTSNGTMHHLRREATAWGVLPSRLRFLPRVPKAAHLDRQADADLFLDTLVYGAHSTATDSVWGGLPVLTLAGDTFASRVGVSLSTNTNRTLMVVHSAKEYQDTAVLLARQRHLLPHIKEGMSTASLFMTQRYAHDLERLYTMAAEVYAMQASRSHLVLPPIN
ncbi:hypothetical protein ACHHYP_16966 [Achlya hypogyna]|uniref:protein O-GlcNAc transferase n=1 Tax=Achlya hypogyna TaxID=1202772 RepID=A0A1V9Y5H5_ACHHY|nr:hypothetical protein ACHHYP_16966 [Achlya hypogyna]